MNIKHINIHFAWAVLNCWAVMVESSQEKNKRFLQTTLGKTPLLQVLKNKISLTSNELITRNWPVFMAILG